MSKLIKNDASENSRLYLNVPFELRKEAKTLGAGWDSNYKLWFVTKHCNKITEITKLSTNIFESCGRVYKSRTASKVTVPRFIKNKECLDDEFTLNDDVKMSLKYKADEIQTLIAEMAQTEIVKKKPDFTNIFGFNKK